MKSYLPKIILGLWSGLGFYRGYESYEDKHIREKSIIKSIGYGFCGLFIYMNPVALPLTIESEYRRLKYVMKKMD